MTAELLLDNSAWARLDDPSLPRDRVEEIASALEEGRIAVCLPFLLEAGYSARHAAGHADLLEELLALSVLHIDETIVRRAVQAQGQLARAAHHRVAARRPHPRRGRGQARPRRPPLRRRLRHPPVEDRPAVRERVACAAGACEERCRASRASRASRSPHGRKLRDGSACSGARLAVRRTLFPDRGDRRGATPRVEQPLPVQQVPVPFKRAQALRA